MNNVRASAIAAMLITGFAVLYAAGSAVAGWEPSLGWLLQAIIHVGELLAVIALRASGAGQGSRTARAGLTAAVAGQLMFVVAEVVWPRDAGIGNVLFGVSPILTGAGLIAAGVAVLRSPDRTGASRLLPLILGLFTVVVLIPVMIGSGGPPAAVALWTIAGWDLLWFVLSASLLNRVGTGLPHDPATARVTVR